MTASSEPPDPSVTPDVPKPDAATPKPEASKPKAADAPKAKPEGAKAEPKAAVPPGPPDPPPSADAPRPDWVEALDRAFPGVATLSLHVGDWAVIAPMDRVLEVLTWMRDAPEARFDFCSDMTAVDWPPRAERFDVVYCLYSIPHRRRARVKVRVADGQPVPTSTGVWPATNWFEREIFDMFGIRFTGHPDLRRILMPDDWQGHPQRKDYPLEGPGELLLESPHEWLKLGNAAREAEFE